MDEGEGRRKLMEHVDPKRRAFVGRILSDAPFAPPLIATFPTDGAMAVWIAGQEAKRKPRRAAARPHIGSLRHR